MISLCLRAAPLAKNRFDFVGLYHTVIVCNICFYRIIKCTVCYDNISESKAEKILRFSEASYFNGTLTILPIVEG